METKTEENPPPPTVESLKELGNTAIRNGKFEEAMLHYTHAIKMDPKNFVLYSNRSFAFLKLKQYSLAMEDAQQTIALNSMWVKGYFRCGEVKFATEQYEDAQMFYEVALKLKPDDQSIYECVEKARRAKLKEQKKDQQVPWVGAGIGIVIGVVILIADYVLTDNPTHPLIMVFATIAISLLGYAIARGLRSFTKSQKKSQLDCKPLPTDEDDGEDSQDVEDEKNGKTRNRYTKSQARQRFRKGKL